MATKQQARSKTRPLASSYLLPYGEPIALADIQDALVIKEGNLFLLTDAQGNLPPKSRAGYGFYKGDTRYLSVYDLSFDGVRPAVLLSTAELGYSSEHHLTNHAMATLEQKVIPKESLEVRRQRLINKCLHETIQVTNFNISQVRVSLRFSFAADFLDIFEVRGERKRPRGRLLRPQVEKDKVIFRYQGLDGTSRSTQIAFSPAPDQLWQDGALFSFSLGHRESANIRVTISPDGAQDGAHFPTEFKKLTTSYQDWLRSCTQVFTSNEFFNAMIERSLNDIRLLMTDSDAGRFVAAGTPWFNCPFGRDAIITSLQMLALNPELAKDTLRFMAKWQGKEADEWREEEPGKILHELRSGELAALGEVPTPYYGTVDATPLFLVLAAEYINWSGDLDFARELEPNIMAALEWIDSYGDVDKCGYVEYRKRSPKGLLNQGWKDSREGIINADGTLVKPPVALVEVQGYVYAAKRGMAQLFSQLGKEKLARRLRREAAALKARFNRDFWLDDEEFYALALDADKAPVASISSNPGQCLWTGIVDRDKVSKVVERLFSNDMFSGWGIRTLSSEAARYNPLGYHVGSVWPHDNSLIGMGLKKYGFEDELNELATALYDCCRAFDYYRLPELFSGVPRTAHGLPVRYPVACRPQAWAAGSLPLLLQAMLGLMPDAPKNELKIVHPHLPYWLEEVEIRGLRLGGSAVDLFFQRARGSTRVSVLARGGVRVSVVRKWPN
ncbi:MAG TPA: amylo-alpha-1,6-glucosidase [Dehalococcoidia bacterium]|jgi:glycogen debranching enzyme|nr:amylo-alpha-1,6-glucosidase [Dehalococcoidia bacterium]